LPQARKNAVLEKSLPPADPNKDARLKREAEVEDKTIKRICEELNVRIHEVIYSSPFSDLRAYLYQVNPDGHCLYSAIADQLALLGIISPDQAHYAVTRHAASEYIWNHPADFLPFLSGENDFSAGVMSPRSFENYCAAIRDSAVWGGEPEILALSRAFNIPIHVVQGASPGVVVHNPRRAPEEGDAMNKGTKVVRISYHRRMYGLGEVGFTLMLISGCSLIEPAHSITTPCALRANFQ
jgi:OTU domain-containing protein 6